MAVAARAQQALPTDGSGAVGRLPPGAGSVPWRKLTPLLRSHPAPLQLEVHPPRRPEPAALAVITRELLGLDSSRR